MSKKTLYFDSYCGYLISAVVEDGKISEFNFEKEDAASIVGNIYKGRVENVLQGMNAAFVNCGLERNCYLSADDITSNEDKPDGNIKKDPDLPEIKIGDEILVQVVKAPVGKKGAKVTVFPSLIGKNIIYMPLTSYIGISQKITDLELRRNLLHSASIMAEPDEGIVLRTSAPYARRGDLELEFKYLRGVYASVENKFKTAEVGALLYSGGSLPLRIIRDTLTYDIEKIVVGNGKLEKLIGDILNLSPPDYRRPVVLHSTGRDMLYELGLSEQIFEIASPKVNLGNGGYLVIEKTEALTVIDVNTGKFTGDENLEQTVYYTNILAAREIARQVKLRNIGGIVVVDFIDMTNASHRKALAEELERALKKDSAKCSVAPMSKFGLVEFTRKRTGTSPLSLMTKPCRHCRAGYVKSPRFTVLGMRAKLLNMYADGCRKIRIDLNAELLTEINAWEEFKRDMNDRVKEAEIYFVPHRTYNEEQIIYACGEFAVPENAVKLI